MSQRLRHSRWVGLALVSMAVLLPPALSSGPENRLKDLGELERLFAEDQADRTAPEGRAIDPMALLAHDRKHEARIKELLSSDRLRTGKDYYRAAMILQHAPTAEDALLAHELCVVAISRGESSAKWLAAASEDRFLMRIGRPQRFGTQYHAAKLGEPVRLYKVEPGVTDALRGALGVPTLAQAREREAEMSRRFPIKTP